MTDKMNVANIVVATFKDDTVLSGQKLPILRKIKLLQFFHIRAFVLRPFLQRRNFIANFLSDLYGELKRLEILKKSRISSKSFLAESVQTIFIGLRALLIFSVQLRKEVIVLSHFAFFNLLPAMGQNAQHGQLVLRLLEA